MFDIIQHQEIVRTWLAAFTDPLQFLSSAFTPSSEQVIEALEFYLKVVAASLVIYGLVTVFAERGSLAVKAKMLANGLLGIVFLFVVAMVVHIPFWLLGGKASFLGTLLTYIYAAAPYAPLMAIAQWILVAGMPADLRRYALNPATAQRAGQVASQDPDTDKFTYFLGCLMVLGLLGWSLFVTFRALGYVHDVGGWWLALAIVLSFLIAIPVGVLNRRMASLIYDDGGMGRAAPPSAQLPI